MVAEPHPMDIGRLSLFKLTCNFPVFPSPGRLVLTGVEIKPCLALSS
jgi:hypothetical protein